MVPRAQGGRERQPRQDLPLRAELILPIPPEELQEPYLKVMFDGEFDLYLNGNWVKTARRDSFGKCGGFWLPPSARASLQSGVNILAARCFQSNRKSCLDIGLIDW